MGFLSDVKSFASKAVQRVEQRVTEKVADVKEAVTEKVSDVKQKAAETLTQAQEEVSGLRSSFDAAKAKVEKAVGSGALTAAINVGDLKKAHPGTLAGVDEEGIAKELSGQALKDPKGVTDAIGGLDSSDRDDVSEELTKSLSDSQLKELAGTPDGRQLLNKLRFELDEGPTWPGEQAQVDRIYDPMPKPGEPQIIYRDKDEASKQKFNAYQNAMFPSPGNTTKGWADPG